jgi:hypothetical protein
VAAVATSIAFNSKSGVVYKLVEPDVPRKSVPWDDCREIAEATGL